MALWIKHGWKIPLLGLLQLIWKPKQEVSYYIDLLVNAFKSEIMHI